MFNAQCYLNNIKYNCERIKKNEKNGLYFTRSDWEKYREKGFNIEAEDPRLFIINNEVYVMFICLSPYQNQIRCIAVTKFNEWNPLFLQIENMRKNPIEKNWAPFVINNKLYFVYNYDPLVIIHYDFNSSGICKIIFKQNNINLPINTSITYLRGGSNLLHYKDNYYIGGVHSRLQKDCFIHFSHIVLLDIEKWELVYLSKPILYKYLLHDKLRVHDKNKPFKSLDTLHNVIIDKTPNLIQDPISLYQNDDNFYITINIRDSVSLLYEIEFLDLIKKNQYNNYMGFWNNKIKDDVLKMLN